MLNEAEKINANTFQFFTRNPRGSKAKDINLDDINKFLELIKYKNFTNIVAHAPYTLNPSSSDNRVREFAFATIKDDLNRMEYLPYNYYNLHPGNHMGQGVEKGIKLIIDLLNKVLKKEQSTIILIETMSGKGTEIGKNFEEIKSIIDNISLSEKIGVCIDTCHIYDAGYDIVNNIDDVINQFDSIIGISKLKAIHLNDTKNPFNSKKDRHEKIGKGFIGINTFINIINHKKLKNIPFILETPNNINGYAEEIKLLKSSYNY